MKQRFFSVLLGVFVAVPLLAAESLVIDGVTYDNIRWGPVNKGKVIVFHNRGVVTIPLEKLPPDLQQRFGYHPPATLPAKTTPAEPTGGTVLVEEVITEPLTNSPSPAAPLTPAAPVWLTGFIRGDGEMTENDVTAHGAIIELAEKKPEAAHVPANMEMRPGLWKATGQMAFLKNSPFTNQVGMLIRVYATETGRLKNYRTFVVAKPPAPPPPKPFAR